MKQYQSFVKDKKEIGPMTYEYALHRPAGFTYLPGQFIEITLEGQETYPFTLASAPHEEDLHVITRQRETAFKQQLFQLRKDDVFMIDGPWGNLILPDDHFLPSIFLAGGIGVTPFWSMIKHVLHFGSDQQLFLFYSNKRPDSAVYLSELMTFSSLYNNFYLIATMTQSASWSGEKGRIDKSMLQRHIHDLSKVRYLIVGAPLFVESMIDMLEQAEVHMNQILVEKFSGYG